MENQIFNEQKNYDCNIDSLVELKFIVEKQFSVLYEATQDAKQLKLHNISDDLDIYAIFTMYNNNIEVIGDEFLTKQTELLKNIDDLLLRKCVHNWIHDVVDTAFSSFNICYCSKCFIRKTS